MRPHLRDSETWCQTQKECEEQSVLEQTLQVGEQTWPNNPVRNGLHAVLSEEGKYPVCPNLSRLPDMECHHTDLCSLITYCIL